MDRHERVNLGICLHCGRPVTKGQYCEWHHREMLRYSRTAKEKELQKRTILRSKPIEKAESIRGKPMKPFFGNLI